RRVAAPPAGPGAADAPARSADRWRRTAGRAARARTMRSYREVFTHHLVGQVGDRAADHHAALVEDAQVRADAPREGQLLLHQQHGEALLAIQARDHIADLAHDVR